MAKKKVKSKEVEDVDGGMPQPDQLLQDLAEKSNNEGQSIDDWIDWLEALKEETRHWIQMANHDRNQQAD